MQQHKGESARIGVSGFLKRFKLQDKQWRVLSVEPQEKALYLKFTDEQLQRRSCQRKPKTPPIPPAPPATPQQPAPPKQDPSAEVSSKRIDYECKGCGYTDMRWKYTYKEHGGHPVKCSKCGGTVFEPAANDPLKNHTL
ncbi:MAG: hypothetical protein LLF76_03185 [Planctomycetaceae bacterium]|nr:hypothetical protein [Planctomycetaceae bacterium]